MTVFSCGFLSVHIHRGSSPDVQELWRAGRLNRLSCSQPRAGVKVTDGWRGACGGAGSKRGFCPSLDFPDWIGTSFPPNIECLFRAVLCLVVSNSEAWTRVEKAVAGTPARMPRVLVCGLRSHSGRRNEFLRLWSRWQCRSKAFPQQHNL